MIAGKWLNIAIIAFLAWGLFNTAIFLIGPPAVLNQKLPPGSNSSVESVHAILYEYSPPEGLISWAVVAGLVIWRGRIKQAWSERGFDQDVFRLFAQMRGAPTRLKMIKDLAVPKNRAQLAQELNIDWKAVDRQIRLLEKYCFIQEKSRHGTTKFYQLTESGKLLLEFLEEQQDQTQ